MNCYYTRVQNLARYSLYERSRLLHSVNDLFAKKPPGRVGDNPATCHRSEHLTLIFPNMAKNALISGCSGGGMGDGTAQEFHNRGLHVFATARDLVKVGHL